MHHPHKDRIYIRCPVCDGRTSVISYENTKKQKKTRHFMDIRICHDCQILVPIKNVKMWNGSVVVDIIGISTLLVK